MQRWFLFGCCAHKGPARAVVTRPQALYSTAHDTRAPHPPSLSPGCVCEIGNSKRIFRLLFSSKHKHSCVQLLLKKKLKNERTFRLVSFPVPPKSSEVDCLWNSLYISITPRLTVDFLCRKIFFRPS
jgi:hypothetical protein